MSNQSGNQLVLDTAPKTMADVGVIIQKIQRWANTQVVNRITNVDDAFSVPILGIEGTGIVTVDTFGGYASLTGPGKTTTPGDLTQLGGFVIDDNLGVSTETTVSVSGSFGVDIDIEGNDCEFVVVVDNSDSLADLAMLIQSLGYGGIWMTTVFGSGAIGGPIIIDAGAHSTVGAFPGSPVTGMSLNPGGSPVKIQGGSGTLTVDNDTTTVDSTTQILLSAGSGFSNGTLLLDGTSAGLIGGAVNIGEAGGDVGFYTHLATPQAAHPTTLADVITILTNLGLCA